MSKNLHVAKVYQIEYASGHEHFNYMVEEFHNLLSSLNIDYYPDDVFSEEIEVSKIRWRKGIDKLNNLAILQPDEQEKINKALRGLEATASEVVSIMKEYLDASDPENCVMYLSFF